MLIALLIGIESLRKSLAPLGYLNTSPPSVIPPTQHSHLATRLPVFRVAPPLPDELRRVIMVSSDRPSASGSNDRDPRVHAHLLMPFFVSQYPGRRPSS